MRTQTHQRVFLHVGVHKSGTTHLQGELLRRRVALREAGVLYPGSESRMFRAALDVRANHHAWGLRRRDVRGDARGVVALGRGRACRARPRARRTGW